MRTPKIDCKSHFDAAGAMRRSNGDPLDKNLINVRVNGVPNVFSMTNNLQVESSKRMSMVQAAAQSRHLQQIGLGRDFSKYGAVLAVYFVATGSPEYNPSLTRR